MALYSTSNINATTPTLTNITTTYTAAGCITSLEGVTATLRRAYLYEFSVGAQSTPNATDCEIVWNISGFSAAGTGVAMTVVPLDGADAATGMTAKGNYTIIPTVTANSSRWTLAANQRASYRWVVNPNGPGEIVVAGATGAAANATGLVMQAKSSTYASTVLAMFLYRE